MPTAAADQPPDLQARTLRQAVGGICIFIGALILLVPSEVGRPVSAGWRPIPWPGLFVLLAGAALIAVPAFAPRPRPVLGAYLSAGLALFLLAVGSVIYGLPAAVPGYVILGLGTALAPLVTRAGRSSLRPGAGADLLAGLIGLSATVSGVIMIASRWSNASGYAYLQPVLPWLGVFFLVSGAALALVQFYPTSWLTRRTAHLAVAVAYLTFAWGAILPSGLWIGAIFHGGLGLTIAILPWLPARTRAPDLTSPRRGSR